jgi:hypothetical protein
MHVYGLGGFGFLMSPDKPVALLLCRMVEVDPGSILIDGVDIRSLGLKQLRSQMSIIPQVRAWLALALAALGCKPAAWRAAMQGALFGIARLACSCAAASQHSARPLYVCSRCMHLVVQPG